MEFTPMQKAAIDHRGGALLISAGAGSGKTRVLIERIMSLIDEGADIDRFLIITYTRAAAAELRGRLSSAIGQRLAENPLDRRMRRQSSLIYRAKINTIHAFCSELIRESAYAAGVRPDFRQMDEAEAAETLHTELSRLLEDCYDELSEEFKLLADMLGAGRDDGALEQIITETYGALQSHPYPEKWIDGQIERAADYEDAGQSPWGALLIKKARSAAEYWLSRMSAELEGIKSDEDAGKAYLESWQATVSSIKGFISALDCGWDAASEFGDIDFPRLSSVRSRKGDEYIEGLKALRDGCKKAMGAVTAGFESPSGALMADMAAVKPVTDELYRLVKELSRRCGEAKRRRGALDFSDLEHLSLAILLNPETGEPTERARSVSLRFDEILVDEYQDVNRVQELIFSAVSRGGENITMVGDVKQSIYRFRLADPGIFLEKYNSYADFPAKKGEAVRIRLAHNFRSQAGILSFVNSVFSRLMSEELGEMSYGEGEIMLAGRDDEPQLSPCVQVCLCETPEGENRAKYEAACAAAYIERLISSGAEINGKPIEAGDIAILLRSMKNTAETFVAALEERKIPASAAGGTLGLFDGFENSYLLSILRVIDNPLQDIPLIAAMRGPVWRFTANELAHIRAAAGGDFYTAVCARAEDDEKCRSFLAELEYFRDLASNLPADALVRAVLDKTGLAAICEARQSGSAERLYMVQGYARDCENALCRGLYGFLNRIDASEPPKTVKSAAGGVTIMSIHGSKGLEFPVVLLCDLSKKFNMSDSRRPLLIHRELGAGAKFSDTARGIEYPTIARLAVSEKLKNETLSEEMRVLYVAMTRARERLVCLCSVKNAEEKLSKLRMGLTDPPAPEFLESCQSAGDWLLAARLCEPDFTYTLLAPDEALAPSGEDAPGEDGEEEPVSEELKDEIRASLNWCPPGDCEGLPSKVTATALKGGFRADEAAEDAEEIAPVYLEGRDTLRRPDFVAGQRGLSPAERGTALHMAMQLINFEKTSSLSEISGEIERMKNMRLITEAQAESIKPEKLLTFFRSELGKRALMAENLQREFKFSVLLPTRLIYGRGEGEVLLQGVIDLFFEEEDGLVLVDFKSDRVSESTRGERAALYEGQLAAYAEALGRITGKKIKEKRLFFFSCDG